MTQTTAPLALPIDEILPGIVEALRSAPCLVVEAPPGAGKTTRVPRALMEASFGGGRDAGEVLVLEPRRLAARLSARRVAEELGEPLGERVGYAVRFEEVSGPRTRLSFITQGILLRRLLGGGDRDRSSLAGVSAVVLDEFHERSLEGDLALALLRRLQRTSRPDLRLVVMSATLDAEPVARFLGDCPRLRSEGRRFAVEIEHAPQPDERPLEAQVASALRRLVTAGLDGDVLVFLPGAREIRRAEEACREVAARAGVALVTLHGDQPPAEQDAALRPLGRPKVILSTNVAETSVTIDGVVAVIDSGLARLATHAPWSGLPSLKVAKISRASATQRAGRAGRTRPGRALRLYTRHDHDTRPEFEVPEVRRSDLADAILLLRASGITLGGEHGFAWFEAPSPLAIEAARTLLVRLGAMRPSDGGGELTTMGRRMIRVPLHPRLARVLCEAEDRGVVEEGALLVSILGEGRRGGADARERSPTTGSSDVLAAMEPLRGAHPGPIVRAQKHLLRRCDRSAPRPRDRDEALLMALLTGFPDRVARRRRPREPEVLLAGCGAATLSPASVVRDAELMVAVDVEEQLRREQGGGAATGIVIRSASAIEADWLLDLFPESLRETEELRHDPRTDRVRGVRRLYYDDVVLDETVLHRPDPERVAQVLTEAALAQGARAFLGGEAEVYDRFQARVSFVAAARPAAGLVFAGEAALRQALSGLAMGLSSLAELREAPLGPALLATLGEHARLVETLAPERITLPGGRGARVEYVLGQPPSVASRLQDFFGLAEGPQIGGVPLTLHLLAPNQRAVQVTSDLAGFWTRHYPAIRRELMRRYPRHAWPDDPLHAEPPQGGRPR